MRKRGNDKPAVRMPATLPRNAWLVVMDEYGKLLRSELLPPGTHLPGRLTEVAVAYTALGWVGQPAPGRWSFIMRSGLHSLAVGIRAARPSDAQP
ncbi:MAG: hypothetical protein JSR66_13540 [Proteobacteria bacterium]|nr:hypothetical protein [Pseudomonadota bacterium]